MWKILPGRAIRAVVLTDGAPLALGQIRAPALPIFLASAGFFETFIFPGLQSGHRARSWVGYPKSFNLFLLLLHQTRRSSGSQLCSRASSRNEYARLMRTSRRRR